MARDKWRLSRDTCACFHVQKEHYNNYYSILRQKTCKRSELAPVIDEYARTIEDEEGTGARRGAVVPEAAEAPRDLAWAQARVPFGGSWALNTLV